MAYLIRSILSRKTSSKNTNRTRQAIYLHTITSHNEKDTTFIYDSKSLQKTQNSDLRVIAVI